MYYNKTAIQHNSFITNMYRYKNLIITINSDMETVTSGPDVNKSLYASMWDNALTKNFHDGRLKIAT